MTFQQQIDFFFAPPLPMQTGNFVSSLYLNRREVQDCLLGDVVVEDKIVADARRHRLFATVMVICAGVDLLAKFYAGSGGSSVQTRIVEFAERFMFPGHSMFAEVLYFGCRNPMLHSFTLHSTTHRVQLIQGLSNPVMTVVPPSSTPTGTQSDTYRVSVEGLFLSYVSAIQTYRTALHVDQGLQVNFSQVFPSYGGIHVFDF